MYNPHGKSDTNELLKQHIPLVKKLAYQMRAKLPSSVEVDDLIQAGMIGLLDALQRYEETHSAQFKTYAMQRIRGSMLDELRNSDWLPRSIRQNARKIEDAIHILQQQRGHPPLAQEVAKQLQMSLAEYQRLLGECSGHQLLYYEDFHDNEDNDAEHFLSRYPGSAIDDPLEILLQERFKAALINAIRALPEREQMLMGLYYEQDMNLKEIGAIMKVSESRVCQLHSQAMMRLRSILRKQAWIG